MKPLRYLLLSFFMLSPAALLSQDSYYYHTIHSSSLAAAWGKTYKSYYTYQLTHQRQLKLTGIYIFDEFDQNRNHIKSDLYTFSLQFQYNILHLKRIFANVSLGAGGYYLEAADKLKLTHIERKVHMAGGVQVEVYLWRNTFALSGDLDLFYFPFSDIYKTLRSPTIGLAFYF